MRTFPKHRSIAVAAAAGALVVTVGWMGLPATASGRLARPAAITVWAPAQPVHLSASLGTAPMLVAISCPAPGDCAATGTYFINEGFQAFIVEQKDGVWGNAQPIPGLAAVDGGNGADVNSVSCASPGNCAVVGDAADLNVTPAGTARGFVVNEVNGVWSTVQVLPPPVPAPSVGMSTFRSVSCSAPGDCLAGGYDETTGLATVAITAQEKDGTWGTPIEVAGAAPFDQVNSVSCAAPGDCVAGLGRFRTGTAELASESGGTWSTAQPVPGLAALPGAAPGSIVYSVACPSAGNCTAAGETGQRLGPLFVVDEKNGSWGDASELAGGNAFGSDVITFDQTPLACASAGTCAVAGTLDAFDVTPPGGFIASEENGTWDNQERWDFPILQSTGAQVSTLSCPSAGNCSAGGYVLVTPAGLPSKLFPVLITETNGTWGQPIVVPGTSDGSAIAAMSCASAESCVAIGNGFSAFITQMVPAPSTATVVSLSARSVVYGHEQTQQVSATVFAAPASVFGPAGVPTGTVLVNSGGTRVCGFDLAGGSGSCRLTAAQFAAGRVTLTAVYLGDASFAASTSSATSFTVTRAGTRTSLRLSTATIRYGHEQAEKLSITVKPAFAGIPTGKVTVKAGKIIICVIKIKGKRGGCTLTAKELKTGTYHLTARYAGAADFTGSTSIKRTLVVEK